MNEEALLKQVADLTARVDELTARAEITEVIHRYVRAVDRLDEELLRSCFHADSTHLQGRYAGPSSTYVNNIITMVGALEFTQHALSNVSILVKGDVAWTEAYYQAYHRVGSGGWEPFPPAREGDDFFIGGRYNDRFERRDGVWKIAHRIGVRDWGRYDPPDDRGFHDCPPHHRGHRDKNDAVYQIREGQH